MRTIINCSHYYSCCVTSVWRTEQVTYLYVMVFVCTIIMFHGVRQCTVLWFRVSTWEYLDLITEKNCKSIHTQLNVSTKIIHEKIVVINYYNTLNGSSIIVTISEYWHLSCYFILEITDLILWLIKIQLRCKRLIKTHDVNNRLSVDTAVYNN